MMESRKPIIIWIISFRVQNKISSGKENNDEITEIQGEG